MNSGVPITSPPSSPAAPRTSPAIPKSATSARPLEPHFAGEIHDSHAAAPQLELQRIAPGERGLEVEEEAVGLVGHEAMLPYCRLYRPLPPAFRFTPLCLTTNPTSLQPSRPPSSRRAR